jgi:hypothetical protein
MFDREHVEAQRVKARSDLPRFDQAVADPTQR